MQIVPLDSEGFYLFICVVPNLFDKINKNFADTLDLKILNVFLINISQLKIGNLTKISKFVFQYFCLKFLSIRYQYF